MKLQAGVIGCGNISKFHFSGLEKAGVKISWVCDLNEETALPWASKFDATFTKNYQDIIADKDVDIIVITTISSVHKVICLAAIAAGKAIICEKTLAESAEDAFEIVAAAEAAGTIFYTSYMKRFIPAVAKAKELLPTLGTIYTTYIRAHQLWGDMWGEQPESGFFHTPEGGVSPVRKNYGGGILVMGGSHILDLVGFFLGRPSKVFALTHTPKGRDYDLQAAALFETENGVCHFEATAHPLKKIGFLRDGWDERVEINGTNGRLDIYSSSWDDVEHKASLLVHYDNETEQSTEYRYDPVSPFDLAVAFFVENIERGEQGGQSRLTGYDVDELISSISRSGQTGQALIIDWKL